MKPCMIHSAANEDCGRRSTAVSVYRALGLDRSRSLRELRGCRSEVWGAHTPRVLAMEHRHRKLFGLERLRRGAAICTRGRVRSPEMASAVRSDQMWSTVNRCARRPYLATTRETVKLATLRAKDETEVRLSSPSRAWVLELRRSGPPQPRVHACGPVARPADGA
jgi:hypothetical protein